MFKAWFKTASGLSILFAGATHLEAQHHSGSIHRTANYETQPISAAVPGVPNSPGASLPAVNYAGRWLGIGYSSGYHACGSDACLSSEPVVGGQCNLSRASRTWGASHPVASHPVASYQLATTSNTFNIVAPSALPCTSCQTPSHNAASGNQHFGNFQAVPGHLAPAPSYGNPYYAHPGINWHGRVQYEPPQFVPQPMILPPQRILGHHPNLYGRRHGTAVPVYSLPQSVAPQLTLPTGQYPTPSAPVAPEISSPSDDPSTQWPWQRHVQGTSPALPNQMVLPVPGRVNEPTPAKPLPSASVRSDALSLEPAPEAGDQLLDVEATGEGVAPRSRNSNPVEIPPVPRSTGGKVPKAEVPTPEVLAPEVLAPEVPATSLPPKATSSPAPATPAAPVTPASPPTPVIPTPAQPGAEKVSDDEDLLSRRRQLIRQPSRR